MNRLLKDIAGFLRVSRIPNLLVIGGTQYLTAIYLVKDFPEKSQLVWSVSFLLLAISTMMIAAAGYIINDYYDQKIDMINRPEDVVIGVKFSRRRAMTAHFLLNITGIAIGFLLNIKVGALHMFSAFFLWYYSNSLRRITLIGNIIIALLTGLTLLLVLVFFEVNSKMVFAYSLFAMAIVLIREVIKDIADVKGDAAFGCESIPVIFGIRGAKIFIYTLSLGSIGLLVTFLVAVESWVVRYYFMGMAPIFAFFIIKLILADKHEEYKNLVRFTNLIIFSGLVSMVFV